MNPFFTDILTRMKEPAINDVKRSFLDPISGSLIVLSDKIYFYDINNLMKETVSSDIDLSNYEKGDSASLKEEQLSEFQSSPKSPGAFAALSFAFMDDYKEKFSEEDLLSSIYRSSTITPGNTSKDSSPYHLFFMGSYVTIINTNSNKPINKSFDLKIKVHRTNRFTVCRLFYIFVNN